MVILGNYGNGYSSKNVYDINGLAPTLKASNNHGIGVAILVYEKPGNEWGKNSMKKLRIRKLTPKECMRLMGFTDEDYNALRDIGLSDSAIYHVAGDSIITTCLVGIISPLVNEQNRHIDIINEYVKKEIINGKESKNI